MAPRLRLSAGAIALLLLARAAPAQMFDDFVLPDGSKTAPATAAPFVIADFDDGKAALRDGTPFLAAPGAKVEIASETKIRHAGKGKSMKVAFVRVEGASTAIGVDLKGLDASKRSSLSFFVFGGKGGAPAALEVRVVGKDGAGKAVRVQGVSPYFWGRQVIPFAKLELADPKLARLEFAVPADVKLAAGSFYLDTVAFE